jgi:hypothetical protein
MNALQLNLMLAGRFAQGRMMIGYYENKVTKEEIRCDPAQARDYKSLLPGRAGVNHWHRVDIDKDGSYLDAEGNVCALSDIRSVLIPRDQGKVDYSDPAYDENIFDEANRKLIDLLDSATDNWLHDSTINDIIIGRKFIKIEFSYYKDANAKLIIAFMRSGGAIEQKHIEEFIGKEVYRLKLHKRNLGNEVEIITTKNASLTLFYDSIEYEERA